MRNIAMDTILPAVAAPAAGGGSSLLLDSITADFAVSANRKLLTSYSGDCQTIRRSSDSLELAIGFDGSNEFDQSAFNSHVGAGQGYCSVLHEQINGHNMIQRTTADQPECVDSGLVTGQKSLQFSSHALYRDHRANYFSRNTYDWFFAVRKTGTAFSAAIGTWNTSATVSGVNQNTCIITSSALRHRLSATNGQVACGSPQNNNALVHLYRAGSSADFYYKIWHSGVLYQGNTAKGSLTDLRYMILGSYEGDSGSGNFDGEIAEVIGRNNANFSSDERDTIRDNMASYYDITLP